MPILTLLHLLALIALGGLLLGCGANQATFAPIPELPYPLETREMEPDRAEGTASHEVSPDTTWSERAVSEEELLQLIAWDPDLTPARCYEILARLNTRARYYIRDDVRNGKVLRVPNDFSAYKEWSPLPGGIPQISDLPKLILVVKDIPFIGWYEGGWLVADAQICIGKKAGWTRAGYYKILTKDADHVSGSYPNAFGRPAPMPFALRIYGRVWIHAGDVTGGYCSHGCINLPLMAARQLFRWAEPGTSVLILNSLADLEKALGNHDGS